MKTRVQIEINLTGFKKLRQYLVRHEDDIALDINDFGDLDCLFFAVFYEPAESSKEAKKKGNQHLAKQKTDEKDD